MRPLLQRAAAAAQEGGAGADREDDLGAEDVEVEVTQDTAGPFCLLLLLLLFLSSFSSCCCCCCFRISLSCCCCCCCYFRISLSCFFSLILLSFVTVTLDFPSCFSNFAAVVVPSSFSSCCCCCYCCCDVFRCGLCNFPDSLSGWLLN